MENNNKLCLYVSYYLSRFNRVGYNNLGFAHMNEAHAEIGRLLDVNPNTVKNMRDGFDPLHGFRLGWYQLPPAPSRRRVIEAMRDLDEFQIRTIVLKILRSPNTKSDDIHNLLDIVNEKQIGAEDGVKGTFIVRGPTGKKAEEYFISHYAEHGLPVLGILIDTREFGTGYDFRIKIEGGDHYVEVKGLADISGGLLFTGKEWEMAILHRQRFHLVVVSNIDAQPLINIITDPYPKLEAKEQIRKSIQVNFSVSAKEVSKYMI